MEYVPLKEASRSVNYVMLHMETKDVDERIRLACEAGPIGVEALDALPAESDGDGFEDISDDSSDI